MEKAVENADGCVFLILCVYGCGVNIYRKQYASDAPPPSPTESESTPLDYWIYY